MSHTLGPLDTDMQLFNEVEARLHAKDDIIADLLEALDEIRSLDPSNIDMAYEIADETIRKARAVS